MLEINESFERLIILVCIFSDLLGFTGFLIEILIKIRRSLDL